MLKVGDNAIKGTVTLWGKKNLPRVLTERDCCSILSFVVCSADKAEMANLERRQFSLRTRISNAKELTRGCRWRKRKRQAYEIIPLIVMGL